MPDAFQAIMPPSGHFIGGSWHDPDDGEYPDVDPHTEQSFVSAPDASLAQVDAAIGAARKAADQGKWARRSSADRSQCLLQLAEALERHADEFAALGSVEWGMTANERMYQIDSAAMQARDTAELAEAALADESLARPDWGLDGYAMRDPVGVVAAITPWNFPHVINMQKLAPALVAGNAVVLKPSPLSPLDALALAKLIDRETDLPDGVVNVVSASGIEAAQLMTTDPRVDLVTFVGSGATGKKVMEAASGTLKRIVLELGGKSAAIYLDDADLDAVLPGAVVDSCALHAGQACILYSRLLVHDSMYEDFVARFSELVSNVKVGDPKDPRSEMGPLITADARDRSQAFVDDALAEGAELVTGGKPPAELATGFYFEPTVLAGVENSMRVARQEVFGPVTCVIPYRTDDEAVQIANDSEYGLMGAVHTRSKERGAALARQIKAGIVAVAGAPTMGYFGGFKQSGIGREGGAVGIRNYTELKSISLFA